MDNIVRDMALEFNHNGYLLYEVGGHVRDRLLNRESNDIDLTTDALPNKSEEILRQFGSVYNVGVEYGTVGVVVDNQKVEVTTFRAEVYPTDSRKPNVIFGTFLFEDLQRRDFTINSLARDPLTEKIIDLYGGLADLENKIVRCVGSEDRLDEDPLRMLRAVRFACQLDFKMEVKINHPERLLIISKERIHDELEKILLSPDPEKGIRLLCDTRLMRYVIPDFMRLVDLKQNQYHIKDAYEHTLLVISKSTKFDFGKDNLIFRLACMLHDIGKPQTYSESEGEIHFYDHQDIGSEMVEVILKDLRFNSAEIERVSSLVKRHMEPIMLTIDGNLTKRGVSRLIRRVSSDNYNDIELLLALVSCDLSSSANPRQEVIAELRKLVNEVQTILPKQKPPLDGNEIMELLNIKPSKLVGQIKEYLSDQAVEGNVAFEDKEKLMLITKKYYEVIENKNDN